MAVWQPVAILQRCITICGYFGKTSRFACLMGVRQWRRDVAGRRDADDKHEQDEKMIINDNNLKFEQCLCGELFP